MMEESTTLLLTPRRKRVLLGMLVGLMVLFTAAGIATGMALVSILR